MRLVACSWDPPSPNVTVELINKYTGKRPCTEIFYSGYAGEDSYIQTKVYSIYYHGDVNSIYRFADRMLIDKIRDIVNLYKEPFYSNADLIVDVDLREGVLDIEKEYILKSLRKNREFQIENINITNRFYIFSFERNKIKEVFEKAGPVNPVIHKWSYKKCC